MKRFIFILLLINLSLVSEEKGKREIEIAEGFSEKNAGKNFIFFEDKSGYLTEWDVLKTVESSPEKWNYRPEDELSLGFISHPVWVYFEIKNKSKSSEKIYLECNVATIDRIELYEIQDDILLKSYLAGDRIAFSKRPVNYRTPVFPLEISRDSNHKILLKLINKGPMKFSLILRNEQSFSVHSHKEQIFLGLYYGIMGIITIFIFIQYLSSKDKLYLYYISYVICVTFYQFVISGNFAQFVFSNLPEIPNRAPNLVANLSFLSGLTFARMFLKISEYSRFLSLAIRSLQFLCTVMIVLSLSVGHDRNLMISSNLLGVLNIAFIIISAGVSYWKGYSPAKFFLFGWSILLITIFIQIMSNLGAFNLTAEHVGQIGSGFEVIFLTFALFHKVKLDARSPERKLETRALQEKPVQSEKKRPVFTILQTEYNLTYQEAQICEHLVSGKSRQIITETLGISTNTLKKHLARIYTKTINKQDGEKLNPQEKLQKLTVFLQSLEK